MNFVNSIRNNPKKSVVGAAICGAAGKWIIGRYNDHLFRFTVCQEVQHYGTEIIKNFQTPRKITVFLNPAANGGGASSAFEKNAAPILHLSGCEINVIRSEHEGQAKQFMSVLEHTDMIVAAGGDGTVHEVVTGLLRRPDFESWRNIPIGVIPLGKTNTICNLLNTSSPERPAQKIISATHNLLQQNTRHMDVLKIEANNGKSIFALSNVRWGSYRDVLDKASKYWYYGPFKRFMSFVLGSMKSSVQTPRILELSYQQPQLIPVADSERNKNVELRKATTSVLASLLNSITWLLPWESNKPEFESSASTNQTEPLRNSLTKYDVKDLEFSTLEVLVSANNHNPKIDRKVASAMVVLEEDKFSVVDFIKNGPYRSDGGQHTALHPMETFEFSKLKFNPKQEFETWFSIDNENYEAMPCTIEVLPNKLNMVCSI